MLSKTGPSAAAREHDLNADVMLLSQLVESARHALERDPDTAKVCLVRATSLLMRHVGQCPEPSARQYAHLLSDQASQAGHEMVRSELDRSGRSRSGLSGWQLRRVSNFIDERLDGPIRSADLASVARLSVGYFSIAFRRSVGETPLSYLARMRVRRAQAMLLSTAEPISMIALACGFCDQAHFSNVFRRTIGMTPSIWRRLEGGGPPANTTK